MEAIKNLEENLIKSEIKNYWDDRCESFAVAKHEEYASNLKERWLQKLNKYNENRSNVKVLDIGCGAGFFSFLMASQGHQVTGIDLVPGMIEEAQQIRDIENLTIDFLVMDAENLDFADDTFDLIITRNLTWTLPNPQKAYAQWFRVLKPGGILINVDADYGPVDHVKLEKANQEDIHRIDISYLHRNDAIKAKLDISQYQRPQWDVDVMQKVGFQHIEISHEVNEKIYQEKNKYYNEVPPFLIAGKKL